MIENPAAQPMLARRLLRLAVVASVENASEAFNYRWVVQTSGDRPVPPEKLVSILIRSPSDNKQAWGTNGPSFTTQVTVEVEGKLNADNQEDAQDLGEALQYQLEECIVKDFSLNRAVEKISSISSNVDLSSEGERHSMQLMMTFVFQICEVFDPYALNPPAVPWPVKAKKPVRIDELALEVDSANVYSATGTFANPDFPNSATPAPRTTGPDGRVEIGAVVDLTQ